MKYLLSLSMTPDEFRSSAKQAVANLQEAFDKMFDTSEYRVSVNLPESGIMKNSVWVTIIKAKPNANTLELANSMFRIKFVMHLANGSNELVDTSKFYFENIEMPRNAKSKGLVFRKLNGRSPEVVTTSLITWFHSNEALIKSFG